MHRIAISLTALAVAGVLAGSAVAAKLSASERKAINRTVDAFVVHAVKHKNPVAAYRLVSPEFRAGLSRAQFAREDPAYPYPARGRHFAWSVDYVLPNEVGGTILLQPEKRFIRKQGPVVFDLIVIRRKGNWVIQSLVPKAIFGTPYQNKVRSVRDFSPLTNGSGPTYDPARIKGSYIVIPFAVFGAFLAFLAGWGIFRWQRDRRLRLDSVRTRDARARPTH